MVTIFSIIVSTCPRNKFFSLFIPFLLNSNLKRINIWMGSCILFCFLKIKKVLVWLKSCLIAVFTVFSWTFNFLAGFLIDVEESFLITVAKAVKKPSFGFFFFFFVQSSTLHFH